MGRNSRKLDRTFLDAIVMGNKDGIRAALKTGADVNAKDYEHDEGALVLAAKFGDAEIVQMLIDAGAEVDALDDMGRTALFYAEVGSDSFARLLAAGADVQARDREGNTILVRKIWESASLSDVEELIRLGIDPEVKNEAGESAIDVAVNLGLLRIIERLK